MIKMGTPKNSRARGIHVHESCTIVAQTYFPPDVAVYGHPGKSPSAKGLAYPVSADDEEREAWQAILDGIPGTRRGVSW